MALDLVESFGPAGSQAPSCRTGQGGRPRGEKSPCSGEPWHLLPGVPPPHVLVATALRGSWVPAQSYLLNTARGTWVPTSEISQWLQNTCAEQGLFYLKGWRGTHLVRIPRGSRCLPQCPVGEGVAGCSRYWAWPGCTLGGSALLRQPQASSHTLCNATSAPASRQPLLGGRARWGLRRSLVFLSLGDCLCQPRRPQQASRQWAKTQMVPSLCWLFLEMVC